MTTLRAASRMVLSEHSESKGVYFVYILRTLSNTLYIGVTQVLDQRIDAHHSGKGAEWTRVHPGAQLVYSESYPTLGLARKREFQLKKWSRAKKEALIAGDVAMLKNLSCRKSAPEIRPS
jgi:putative endonuclease